MTYLRSRFNRVLAGPIALLFATMALAAHAQTNDRAPDRARHARALLWNSSFIGDPDHMSWAQLGDLVNAGNEIGGTR